MELKKPAGAKLKEVQGQPGNKVKKSSVENAAKPEGSSYAEDKYPHEKPQRVPVKVLPPVKPLPRFDTWVPIRKNVLGEDEKKLHNIPYVVESMQEKNHKFFKDLMEVYDGVHGDDKPSFRDDAMCADLVDAIAQSCKEQKEEERETNGSGTNANGAKPKTNPVTRKERKKIEKKRRRSVTFTEDTLATDGKSITEKIKSGNGGESRQEENSTFPKPLIFEVVSKTFPKMGTPEQLTERYSKYTGRKDPKNSTYCPPNIDGNAAESLSAERSLSNYNRLFCRRCFIYCCPLHPPEKQPVGMNFQKRPPPPFKPSKEPCGSDCFMLLSGMKDSQSEDSYSQSSDKENIAVNGVAASVTKPKKSEIFKPNPIWTNNDISIFRVLRVTLLKDYCSIAKAMLWKTCQQVYEFDQKEPDPFPITEEPEEQKLPRRKKRLSLTSHCRKLQLRRNSTTKELSNYKPCKHAGPCDANCSCIQANNCCEKFCVCILGCENRFPGCKCKKHCNTKHCPCFVAFRECDPDVCRSCGSGNFDLSNVTCKNISVQRGLSKKLYKAPSAISGWGCFIKDGAKKNEFISEYCGELISQEEAERRGKFYDKRKCSFLFNLNKEYSVDATRLGNIIRFANHSNNPNCCAKILSVNGDHRIAIYAHCDIKPDEELFFDYRYGPNETLKFVNIERNKK